MTKMVDIMKSAVAKRSIVIDKHKTSVSLEDQFWMSLKAIASEKHLTLSELVSDIDGARKEGNLSSALRLFVLAWYRQAAQVAASAEAQDTRLAGQRAA
jgi:predicted DNA-binding ribbon-helix-helix protein